MKLSLWDLKPIEALGLEIIPEIMKLSLWDLKLLGWIVYMHRWHRS